MTGRPSSDARRHLLALGVAPTYRRGGLGRQLLAAGGADRAEVTLAERDAVEPVDVAVRREIAVRLLEEAGFVVDPATGPTGSTDPTALVATRRR